MSTRLEVVEDLVLDRINQICGKFGLNNIMAQLYVILYLSGKPLSLDDMADRLKISKGSVSINVRVLERYNAVRSVWVKGSRKDYYEAEADIYKVIADRAKSMFGGCLSEFSDMIGASSEAINAVNPSDQKDREAVEIFKERLDRLKNLQGGAQGLFDVLESGMLRNLLFNTPEKDKQVYVTR